MLGLRDLWKDWRRWNAAERIGAVSILLAMFAMAAVMVIAAHSV